MDDGRVESRPVSTNAAEDRERGSAGASNEKPKAPIPWLFSQDWFLWLILAAAIAISYHPAWNGRLIWDDQGHITRPDLRSFEGFREIWTKPGATQQYYPVVHSIFWLEYRLWGDATPGYHFLSIFLHAFSALLLVKILKRLKIPGAWPAAAIFALHPVQVESVAWISELKNTLSGVFFFSAILAYLQFDSERKRKLYAISLLLFLLGLLSKSAIAPLPVALLIIFWWRRGALRWKRDVLPLLPFFVLGIASGLFTTWMERTYIINEAGDEFRFSLIERSLIAGRAFWFYLEKLFWPSPLIFIYPRWDISARVWWQFLFPAAVLLLAGCAWLLRGRWRAPLAGFLFFSSALFPALGFFNVYPFRFSFVADHFQYLACLGPIAFAAAMINRGFGLVERKGVARRASAIFYGILLIGLGFLTWRQCSIYKDIDGLYKSIIAKNPSCWMAWYNLGYESLDRKNAAGAIPYFQKTIEIKPGYILAYVNMGNALMRLGRSEEGIAQYRKALEIDSNYVPAYTNLASALVENGRAEEGIAQFRKAAEKAPSLAVSYFNLGTALMQTGRMEEGIADYRKALGLDPHYAAAQVNLGWSLLQTGHASEAARHLQRALEIDPELVEAHATLGYALVQSGHLEEAVIHFQKALQAHPDDFRCLSALRDVYLKTGRLDEAIRVVQAALASAKSAGEDTLAAGIAGDLRKLQDLKNRGADH